MQISVEVTPSFEISQKPDSNRHGTPEGSLTPCPRFPWAPEAGPDSLPRPNSSSPLSPTCHPILLSVPSPDEEPNPPSLFGFSQRSAQSRPLCRVRVTGEAFADCKLSIRQATFLGCAPRVLGFSPLCSASQALLLSHLSPFPQTSDQFGHQRVSLVPCWAFQGNLLPRGGGLCLPIKIFSKQGGHPFIKHTPMYILT